MSIVKRCKPSRLTIAEDLEERIDRKSQPVFSGQRSPAVPRQELR